MFGCRSVRRCGPHARPRATRTPGPSTPGPPIPALGQYDGQDVPLVIGHHVQPVLQHRPRHLQPAGRRRLVLPGAKAEEWDTTASTYTAWNPDRTVKSSRALTAAEKTSFTAGDAQRTGVANQATIQANIQTHVAQLETWMTANSNGAILTAA